jgi:GNAT superfamily N-acetyltransferase
MVVVPAEPAHVEAIAALAEEMNRFYGATEVEPLEVRTREIHDALFRNPPAAYALLAWKDHQPAGFAAYSFLWPAVGLTRSLYLKELYVADAYRHTGVGTVLMQSLFELAVELDCSRVEWTTDEDNPAAQVFYDQLGVPVNESKRFYRLEGEALHQAAMRRRKEVRESTTP